MKLIITTLSFLIFSTMISAQSLVVPNEALESFEKQFNNNKDAQNIVWTKIESGYQLNYSINENDRVLIFDDLGSIKETKVSILPENLNPAAVDYIKNNYKKAKIISSFEVSSNTAPERNEVQIKTKGKIINVYFRPNGDFHYQK